MTGSRDGDGSATPGAGSSRDDSVTPGEGTEGRPEEPTRYVCDLCGNFMLDLHCKLVCERCGYKRDCSDP